MIPRAAAAAVPSTETFGLPEDVPALIAKLRGMDPAQLANILKPKEKP